MAARCSSATLKAEPNVRRSNVALPNQLAIDPMTFGLGATWRF
jgi:outer membrane protein W